MGYLYTRVENSRASNENGYSSGPSNPFVGNPIAIDSEQASLYATYTPLASVPVNELLPSITGTAQVGQTLSAGNGSWSDGPSKFAYQWLRCDDSGDGCQAIIGAEAQSYLLTGADVGSTMRVREIASNAAGPGAPAVSAQTATVQSAQPRGATGETTTTGTVNAAGTSATSGGSAEVSAEQAMTGEGALRDGAGTTTTRPSTGASRARILSRLSADSVPKGKEATIEALLHGGGYALSFKTPDAGIFAVAWYLSTSRGGRAAPAGSQQPLIAAGRTSCSRPGAVKLVIRLSSQGRELLRAAKQIRLIARASFTPTASEAIVALKTFLLTR